MGTAEGIATLRQAAGVNRKELAAALGISGRSVSRYEDGYEPGSKILWKLARFAEEKGLLYLKDLFESKRRADVISKVNKGSSGSERRISVTELAHWDKTISDAFWALEHTVLKSPMEQYAFEILVQIAGSLSDIQSEIHMRVAPNEQSDMAALFRAEIAKRMGPNGQIDLTEIVLGPNIHPGLDGRSIKASSNAEEDAETAYKAMREKLQGVKPAPKKKVK